jgi:hypothetical protein
LALTAAWLHAARCAIVQLTNSVAAEDEILGELMHDIALIFSPLFASRKRQQDELKVLLEKFEKKRA